MPMHDWTRVSDGTIQDFHYSWVLELKRALKRGLLPAGYYVMVEQFGGDFGAPDVLTLQTSESKAPSPPSLSGTATLTEKPPAVHVQTTIARDVYARLQRTLVIRQTSDDRIVALIEVLSRGNKSSRHALRSFVDKLIAALDTGIHLLLIDVHPPGPRDPQGIHGVLMNEIGIEDYALPEPHQLTTSAYVGGVVVKAFVSHFTVAAPIPTMPLFLTAENYIDVPLEATYQAAWEDLAPQHQAALNAPA